MARASLGAAVNQARPSGQTPFSLFFIVLCSTQVCFAPASGCCIAPSLPHKLLTIPCFAAKLRPANWYLMVPPHILFSVRQVEAVTKVMLWCCVGLPWRKSAWRCLRRPWPMFIVHAFTTTQTLSRWGLDCLMGAINMLQLSCLSIPKHCLCDVSLGSF